MPLRVLMVQEQPEIRTFKMARLLHEIGAVVDQAYTVVPSAARLTGVEQESPYRREFRLSTPGELAEVMRDYDVIHTHNAPDRWPALALVMAPSRRRGQRSPRMIWDCHDLVSLLEVPDPRGGDVVLERLCVRHADGVIWAAPGFAAACENYFVPGEPRPVSVIVKNTPSRWMMNTPWRNKRSLADGKRHVVYAGSLSGQPGNHRYFVPAFAALLQACADVVLHVLPAVSPKTGGGVEDLAAYHALGRTGRLVWHAPVPPHRLIGELSAFDVGWLPFSRGGGQARFVEAFVPNKLFEYRAAGLWVAAGRLKGIGDEVASWGDSSGMIWADSVSELASSMPAPLQTPASSSWSAVAPFESQRDTVLASYGLAG